MTDASQCISAYERWFLRLLDSSDDPLLCDGQTVRHLVDCGLIKVGNCGWMISPMGRMRAHQPD